MKKRVNETIAIIFALIAAVACSYAVGKSIDPKNAVDHVALIELSNRYAWGIDTMHRECTSSGDSGL